MSNHREYLEARNKDIRQLRRDGLTLREIGEKYGHDKVITNENKHEFKSRHDSERA